MIERDTQQKRAGYFRNQIEHIAKNTLEQSGLTQFPINPIKIALWLGLSVEEARFKRADVSGMVDPKEKQIIVAEGDSDTRKRFSVAHELGHYILHYNGLEGKTFPDTEDYHVSYRDNVSTQGFDIAEIEANYFAANLLMPANEVISQWNLYGSVSHLATYFWVSKTAMRFRLEYLGCIDG